MEFSYVTADVFTDRMFGGNQLAVFPRAEGIPEELLQTITREFNFSETVFIYPPSNPAHTRRLRIFTPGGELPFAGHPTVGSAHVLAALGEIALAGDTTEVVFEEPIGPVPVTIRAEGGLPVFTQLTSTRELEIGPASPGRSVLAEMLALEPSDITSGTYGPQSVSAGVPYLMVPVKDSAAVARARLQIDRWEETLSKAWAPHVMVFARGAGSPLQIHARVFLPGIAILEDPATGAAATALGGYLGARDPLVDGTLRWRIAQGAEIERPSSIDVEADKAGGLVTAVRVGGRTVIVTRGTIVLPDEAIDAG